MEIPALTDLQIREYEEFLRKHRDSCYGLRCEDGVWEFVYHEWGCETEWSVELGVGKVMDAIENPS